MPINNNSNSNTNNKKSLSTEDLANFNLEVYSCARQLQNLRSGLLSNSDALRTATFEHFSKGLIAINSALEHARLFGGDTKEEQIQAMKEFASASSGASKEAIDIVQNMLDRFSTEYQTRSNNPSIATTTPTTPTTTEQKKDDSVNRNNSHYNDTPQNEGASTNKTADEGNCSQRHDFLWPQVGRS